MMQMICKVIGPVENELKLVDIAGRLGEAAVLLYPVVVEPVRIPGLIEGGDRVGPAVNVVRLGRQRVADNLNRYGERRRGSYPEVFGDLVSIREDDPSCIRCASYKENV